MWRVTHVDHHQRRRQLVLPALRRSEAEAEMVQRYGAPHYLAAIRLKDGQRAGGRAC